MVRLMERLYARPRKPRKRTSAEGDFPTRTIGGRPRGAVRHAAVRGERRMRLTGAGYLCPQKSFTGVDTVLGVIDADELSVCVFTTAFPFANTPLDGASAIPHGWAVVV